MSASGSITATSGDFATGVDAGTIQFLGAGSVNATGVLNFWNVNLPAGSGGVNFGNLGNPTIHNELVINNNRFVDLNAPFYANTSTLVYNTGNAFVAASEWYALFLSGRGVPHHVQIGRTGVNNTTVNFGASTNWRYASGNITIGDGVGTGYNFSLSNASGGDVRLGGNWILNNNASFTPNDREVSFAGTSLQQITGTQSTSFDFLRINNPAGVNMERNTTAFFLTLQTGLFTPGTGRTLFIKNGGTVSNSGHSGSLPANATGGTLHFEGAGTVTAHLTNGLSFWDVWLAPTGSAQFFSFGSDAGSPVLHNSLTINAQRFLTNSPLYGTGSTLIYNSGGSFERNVEWGAASGRGYPHHVRIQNNTTLNFHNSNPLGYVVGIEGDLILGHESAFGSLDLQNRAHRLIVKRDVIMGANTSGGTSNLILGNVAGGDIEIGRNFTRNNNGGFNANNRFVFFTGSSAGTISAPAKQAFPFVIVDKAGSAANTLTLNQAVDVTQKLTLTSGRIITNATNILSITNDAPDGATVGVDVGDTAISNNDGYVDGPMRRSTRAITAGGSQRYLFPVGKFVGGIHHYKRMLMRDINGTGNSYFEVEYQRGLPPGIGPWLFQHIVKGISANEYWDINREDGALEGHIILPYNGPSSWLEEGKTTFDPPVNANVAIVRGNPVSLGLPDDYNWNFTDYLNPDFEQIIPPVQAIYHELSGDVMSRLLTEFSPFTFGWGFNSVLPLRLLSFTAALHGADALLHWTLDDAADLKHFEVEHSTNGQQFNRLDMVAPNGGTDFNYRHPQLPKGVHYYRLRMVQKDGAATYSQVAILMVDAQKTIITGLKQNPVVGGQARIGVFSQRNQQAEAVVLDMAGRMLLRQKITLMEGYNEPVLSVLPLPAAMYKLLLRTDDGVQKTMTMLK
jgi:hypothetical protein